MISASFFTRGGALCGFRVCGHSGRGAAGADIVCAAVSALTMFTANLLTESFSLGCEMKTDEEKADITLKLIRRSETGEKIIATFKTELDSLSKEYPQNISTKEIENA